MATIVFYAQFTQTKVGKNSITVTWDIERVTRSNGTRSALVTGGATNITIGRRGLYGYRLTDADLNTYDYVATAITADSGVDAQEVPALWTYWGEGIWDAATRTLSSFGTLAADVWAYATRTLTSFATLADDVWAYSPRTLTQTAAQVTSALTGSTLTLTNRVTFSATITGLTIPATWTAIYFTAKVNDHDPDKNSVLQMVVSNPGAGSDGIKYFLGNAAGSAVNAYGSLTVDQPGGEIVIAIADDADFYNAPAASTYDIKCLLGDGTSVLLVEGGAFNVQRTQTFAV